MTQRLSIGAVPFVSAWPLIDGLTDRPGVVLRLVEPSKMGALLRAGKVDAALLPVAEYFCLSAEVGERSRRRGSGAGRLALLVVLRAGALGSQGPVGSVRLFGYTKMDEVKRVLLDPASRSANTLVRVLLNRCFHVHPHFVFPNEIGRDPARGPDAELVIGDEGLVAERPEAEWVLDLGLEWERYVHRPFVYAMWVARADAPITHLTDLLVAAREAGLAARDALACRAEAERGIPADRVRDYLTSQIRYDFGSREREGLLRFYRMMAEDGLAPAGGRLRLAAENG